MPYLFFCDWPTSLSIMVLFITLTGVMGLQVYAYVQAHQVVHIKYVQDFLYINYASIKLLKKKKKKQTSGETCSCICTSLETFSCKTYPGGGWGVSGELGAAVPGETVGLSSVAYRARSSSHVNLRVLEKAEASEVVHTAETCREANWNPKANLRPATFL